MIIKQIKAEETYPLRLSVLKTCEEYIYHYQGDFDQTTQHFGAFIADELVGIVSLMQNDCPLFKGKQMQLRGMAVANNLHGKSIGAQLVNKVKLVCKQLKTDVLWCNAREKVIKFYTKQGFKIIGQSFNIEYVGMHYTMFVDLTDS